MHKFKIGDEVKVVDEQKMLDHFVPHYSIRQGTVTQVYDDGCVKLREDECGYWYPENCLDYDRKFDPKPGDTIVCRGGSRWTACAVEDYPYREYHPEAVITTEIRPPHHNHMVWKNFDGIAENTTFDIVEVIPALVSPPEPVPTPKTYTVREVLEAYREYNGYSAAPSDMSVNGTQKLLDRRDDPDYTTYLVLKKRFEQPKE